MRKGFIALMLGSMMLMGCQAPMPIAANEESSAIGVSIDMDVGLFNLVPHYANVVYFIKLRSVEDFSNAVVIKSNYSKGKNAYLLNAPPGDYAIVAASTLIFNSSGGLDYLVFFPKSLIEKTRVRVGGRQILYAGSYAVKPSTISEADNLQHHYGEIIEPGSTSPRLLDNIIPRMQFVTTYSGGRDDEVEFLNKAKNDLLSGGWSR